LDCRRAGHLAHISSRTIESAHDLGHRESEDVIGLGQHPLRDQFGTVTSSSEPRDVKCHQEGGLADFPQWQIPVGQTQHGSSLDLLGCRQIR
jgi:hypothetical protein